MPLRDDKEIITATIQADNDFMREFVEEFLKGIPQDMHALRNALEQQDAVSLERRAHSLKSVVGFFKAMGSYELARELEFLGRDGKLAEGGEKFAELEVAIEQLQSVLTAAL